MFGREAAVELPPCDDDFPLGQIETPIDGGATDLAGAMRLARACFPVDYAKRIVVLSDGNENTESALAEARALLAAGIGIDVVPLRRERTGDVAIERVVLPGEVQKSTPFDVRVVVNNSHVPPDLDATTVPGKLQVFRRSGDNETLVTEQEVNVEPGKRVFSFRDELAVPDFYTYEARFAPAQRSQDSLAQNNQASSFTQVAGSGRAHAGRRRRAAGRVQSPGRSATQRTPGSGRAAKRSGRSQPGRTAAVRHCGTGQCGANLGRRRRSHAVRRRADRRLGPQHPATGLRAGDARRPRQLSGPAAGRTRRWNAPCRSISKSRTTRWCPSERWSWSLIAPVP